MTDCKAPPSMWDEFVATATHLTNLTRTLANRGKTPHLLWYCHKPQLSHICEIGCQAYAFITTNNLKLFPHSFHCTYIDYTLNSKAYHLWDLASNQIFDSFHVSFIKSHELKPTITSPSIHHSLPTPPSFPFPPPHPVPNSGTTSSNTSTILTSPPQQSSPTILPHPP